MLLAPLLCTAGLLTVALALWLARDVGAGRLATPDRRAPRLVAVGSATAHALREETVSLAIWTVASAPSP